MKECKEGILGVLGGMGPQATNTFYQRIIDRTQAEKDQEHLQVLIWSDAKIPDRTAGILAGPEAAEQVYQALLDGARLLERAGCTVLAIPCNTSHYFADRLQGQLKIPLIHMIRETVAAIQAMGKKTVGILATDGTVRTGIYQKELTAAGLTPVTLPEELQGVVMSIIYDEIKRGETGSREKFGEVDAWLRQAGCDCAILGCTELSVYRNLHSLPPYYIDAMEVLAQQAILRCGKQLRNV
ncbi:aspartate/glutamate racemase family protein [Evtepia sp.]